MIVNTPNNPTGVIYSEETIQRMAAILNAKQQEFGTDIYLISDEPYRELAYDKTEVPYLTKYYDNTVVGYSFSKSLSLPGERIGYLVIPDEAADSEMLIRAANVATRILGFVNAPTLQQKLVKYCLEEKRTFRIMTGIERYCIRGFAIWDFRVSSRKERFICS